MLPESTRDEREAAESLDSFLTKRQLEVLQLRHQGWSQQEVADRLGTTRPNISILEKRAHQNIERAERTRQQWMMISAPISLKAEAGTDVFDLPRMIFTAADKKGIKLPVTSLDIVVQLWQRSLRLFKERVLEQNVEIFVTKEGEVLVEARE
jgi:Tfx family DNA-binding protein